MSRYSKIPESLRNTALSLEPFLDPQDINMSPTFFAGNSGFSLRFPSSPQLPHCNLSFTPDNATKTPEQLYFRIRNLHLYYAGLFLGLKFLNEQFERASNSQELQIPKLPNRAKVGTANPDFILANQRLFGKKGYMSYVEANKYGNGLEFYLDVNSIRQDQDMMVFFEEHYKFCLTENYKVSISIDPDLADL